MVTTPTPGAWHPRHHQLPCQEYPEGAHVVSLDMGCPSHLAGFHCFMEGVKWVHCPH